MVMFEGLEPLTPAAVGGKNPPWLADAALAPAGDAT